MFEEDNVFTASNGVKVRVAGSNKAIEFMGGFSAEWKRVGANNGFALDSGVSDALSEFYLHLRDKELGQSTGRWRSPADPAMLVYPREGYFLVANDVTGTAKTISKSSVESLQREARNPDGYALAIIAFLDEHRSQEPWEEAKEGDVWLATLTPGGTKFPAIFMGSSFRTAGGSLYSAREFKDAELIYREGVTHVHS